MALDPDFAYAYITNKIAGLMVMDIHDPNNPALIAEMPQLGRANGICLSGDYAYIADGLKGLCIVDIAKRDAPEIVSSLDVEGTPYALCVKGSLAYIANGKGLVIADCSDPENPYIKGGVDAPGEAQGICLYADGHLYNILNNMQSWGQFYIIPYYQANQMNSWLNYMPYFSSPQSQTSPVYNQQF